MRLNLKSFLFATAIALAGFTPTIGHAQGKAHLKIGQQYYISASDLNVRSSNSTTAANIVGKLAVNDVVELYDTLNEATPLVQVKIIKSLSVSRNAAPELFVSKDYLSEKPIAVNTASPSKYFVIQNIATEKTRVYERCTASPDCAHKMIFETDTVVGRPEEGTSSDPKAFITWLGHSRIANWVKFYSDGAGTYPPWYTAGQDIKTIPGPISTSITKTMGAKKWTGRFNGRSTMYGAFGWYAARLTPADDTNGVNYQWIHGTIGWGRDEDKAIEITRGFFVNLFSNPGSHGCTRLENRSVAFMRHLLPVGTDIYRVYARESLREQGPILSRYVNEVTPGHWEYILLTDGAQKTNGLTADAATIRASGISVLKGVNFLEQGVFNYLRYPKAAALDYTSAASRGKSGDRYKIDSGKANQATNFRGYYLVDEGRFVGYQHPNERAVEGKVKVSGLPDFRNSVPTHLATTGTHYPPAITYKGGGNGGEEE